MWNVKMKWLLGFSISKISCIWVFNRLAKNIEGCLKFFKLPYLIQSQIWLNLPMDDCHFWLHHKIDPKLNTPLCCLFQWPRKGAFSSVLEWICWSTLWSKQSNHWTLGPTPILFFSFSPFKANTNLRATSINKLKNLNQQTLNPNPSLLE
jgi:hypothetical protein